MAAITLTGRLPVLLALDVATLLPGLYLAGALLLAAAVIAVIRRWRSEEQSVGPDASDQLARFRTLYEQGAISEEEFKRLRNVLAAELRQAIDLPPLSVPGRASSEGAAWPGE